MINSVFQQKPVIWTASLPHDLNDENVPVILSFLWAFEWYYFHPNKTSRVKRTKTVPELFARGSFIFDTVLLGSKNNNSSAR